MRVAKNGSSTEIGFEAYVLDEAGRVTLEFDNTHTNKPAHRYLNGSEVDQVFADERYDGNGNSQGIAWPMTDLQESVRDVLDPPTAPGSHVHTQYDAFGKITSNVPGMQFSYTGREWDVDAGLYYYRARWYDPALGKFISEDPLGLDGGDANLYRYVGNDPVNSVDPFGLFKRDLQRNLTLPSIASLSQRGSDIIYDPGPTWSMPRSMAPISVPSSFEFNFNESLPTIQSTPYVDPLNELLDRGLVGMPGNVIDLSRAALDDDRLVKVTYRRSLWDDYDEQIANGYDPGWFVRYVSAPLLRSLAPRSEPDQVLHFASGRRVINLGGGPSNGDLAGQALTLVPAARSVAQAAKPVAAFGRELVSEVFTGAYTEATHLPFLPIPGRGRMRSAPRGTVPHGFYTADEFANFGDELQAGLRGIGIDDAHGILQGSSVTGVRRFSKPGIPAGTPFDAIRTSDFDVAIASPQLLRRADSLGIPLRGRGTRSQPLGALDLQALGLQDLPGNLSQRLFKSNGRDINLIITNSAETAFSRGPSIRIPTR
jgi:RHS repeat-associated protein